MAGGRKNSHTLTAPVVITSHMNADFDALSSMVAASKLYPNSILIFPGSQEKNINSFFIQSAIYLYNFRNYKEIDPDSVHTLVVVDTRQKSRIPHVHPLLEKEVSIHTYDHHPDSDDDLRAEKEVVRFWGATASILVELIQEQG
ncbi:MAG: DHH family phosphoesterase, partial [Desulfovibrionales bacterium]